MRHGPLSSLPHGPGPGARPIRRRPRQPARRGDGGADSAARRPPRRSAGRPRWAMVTATATATATAWPRRWRRDATTCTAAPSLRLAAQVQRDALALG